MLWFRWSRNCAGTRWVHRAYAVLSVVFPQHAVWRHSTTHHRLAQAKRKTAPAAPSAEPASDSSNAGSILELCKSVGLEYCGKVRGIQTKCPAGDDHDGSSHTLSVLPQHHEHPMQVTLGASVKHTSMTRCKLAAHWSSHCWLGFWPATCPHSLNFCSTCASTLSPRSHAQKLESGGFTITSLMSADDAALRKAGIVVQGQRDKILEVLAAL